MKDIFAPFASLYDILPVKKAYEKEANFVESMRKRHGIEGKRLLDVGCGTGEHLKYFQEMGYTVTGIDKSETMIRMTRKKLPRAELHVKDMRTLRLQHTYDQITCFSDSIHHLEDVIDLKRTFINLFRHLNSPGIFICDLSPFSFLHTSKITVDSHPEGKNPALVRVGLWDPCPTHVKTTFLWAFRQKKGPEYICEEHILTKFSVHDVKKAMEEAGFIVSVYEAFSLQPHTNLPVFVGMK